MWEEGFGSAGEKGIDQGRSHEGGGGFSVSSYVLGVEPRREIQGWKDSVPDRARSSRRPSWVSAFDSSGVLRHSPPTGVFLLYSNPPDWGTCFLILGKKGARYPKAAEQALCPSGPKTASVVVLECT